MTLGVVHGVAAIDDASVGGTTVGPTPTGVAVVPAGLVIAAEGDATGLVTTATVGNDA